MIVEVACPIPVFKTFDYLLPDDLNSLDSSQLLGRRALIPFGFNRAIGVICAVKEHSTAPLGKLKRVTALVDDRPLLNRRMLDLGSWLSNRYVCSLGESLFALLPPRRNEFKSISKVFKPRDIPPPADMNVPLVPTSSQTEAGSRLTAAHLAGGFKPFLLMGLAATGKTEVYMNLIQQVLSRGKRALVLAPEIGLVEQLGAMLGSRFGADKVLTFHSDVPPQKRIEDWERIRSGEAPIVLGARATILAPLDEIGLIIIDEEHDTAYKEDRKPRFHVRDVAWERARQHGALLIYGGATPSLELLHKADRGDVVKLELFERAVPSERPQIEVVDLTKNRTQGLLSMPLIEAMAQRFRVHEQVILLLNRRGFYRYLKCPHCSWIARCPQCGIALVHHKMGLTSGKGTRESGFWCHYCAFILKETGRCPDCGKKELVRGGFGTQRIEEEIQKQFPWAHVARWDRDAVTKRGRQKGLYDEFLAGKFDVLIGTQIVAQGFNFPKVTLVGILDADTQLHIPDFRSAERTFQMITQAAGRSGRAEVGGKVVVQTHLHDHYALHFAAQGDLNGFAAHELKFREELNYPPYRHLVKVVTLGKNASRNSQQLVDWGILLNLTQPVALLGPSPVKQIKGKGSHQFQVLFKVATYDFQVFLSLLREVVSIHPVDYFVDVDPQSL